MSIPVKGSDNATYQVQQASLGEGDKSAGVAVTLPTNGNHAKSADIASLSTAITGALAPNGGLAVSLQGTAAVTQSGTWTVGLSPGATVALAGGNTVALKVDGSAVTQPVSGTVTVGSLPALPAGTSKIGSVDVSSLPATAAKDATLSGSFGTAADAATPDITATGAGFTFVSLFKGMVANLLAIKNALAGALTIVQQPFRPIAGATKTVTVGSTATAAGALPVAASGAIPVGAATSYRVRNPAASASPVTWILSTDPTKTPVLPTPYAADGTGGAAGDKTMDPGSVEVIGLSAAQQAALAAGTLYLSAVTPGGGSATLSITPGIGA